MKIGAFIGIALLGLTSATGLAASRPIVVELFTSQACSSCPPADTLLSEVQAQNRDVLALDLHVTYWNGAAWTDPYSLRSATDRQKDYARLGHSTDVYTPEAVVDGEAQFVGSDRAAMRGALESARAKISAAETVTVAVEAKGDQILFRVGSGAEGADLWLFGFDPEHATRVLGGENGGSTLREVNVVRSITKLGSLHGAPMADAISVPAGMKFAVIVQRRDGAILGAATN